MKMRSYEVKFHSIKDVEAFVNITNCFGYEIKLKRGEVSVDAKSILGVLSLGIETPLTLLANTLNASELKRLLTPYLVWLKANFNKYNNIGKRHDEFMSFFSIMNHILYD